MKLRDRGATVVSFDSSVAMLELARKRLGPDTDLRLVELAGPLPYPDRAFDDVIAALLLHYLQDWTGPLAELRRVLAPGGRLIVAVDHPFAITLMHQAAGHMVDYFATHSWTDEWTFGGHSALMTFWLRPLHAMTDAFTAAGFRTAVISEPPPAPDTPAKFRRRIGFIALLRDPVQMQQDQMQGSEALLTIHEPARSLVALDIHERPEEERLRRVAVVAFEPFPEIVNQDLHVVLGPRVLSLVVVDQVARISEEQTEGNHIRVDLRCTAHKHHRSHAEYMTFVHAM